LARPLLKSESMIDVGQTVGNYNVVSKLGDGGMGIVFLAEHPVIGSKVALKAIHPHLARSADVVSRFVTEARVVNQIGHDHIVNITDFGHTPAGDFYFLMEYLQGDMLSEWINGNGALPPARALHIAAQIADALQASHEQGVIHRDLKPDNIFLIDRDTTPDFVKVLDFGLAKLTHAGGETARHQTGAGMVMGSPYYMAPEQCEGRSDVDHRADVYALGVILFEMLTGCVPFGGRTYGEVINKHLTLRPPAARSLVPNLPPVMDAILSRALSKAPEDRFQSMSDFRDALLDPEGYRAALPESLRDDDHSGRIRQALPMARTEMNLEPASREAATWVERPTPRTPSVRDQTAAVDSDDDLKPKRSRAGAVIVFLGVTALTGLALARLDIRPRPPAIVGSPEAPAVPPTGPAAAEEPGTGFSHDPPVEAGDPPVEARDRLVEARDLPAEDGPSRPAPARAHHRHKTPKTSAPVYDGDDVLPPTAL
jgi:serine/threonine protein kinase